MKDNHDKDEAEEVVEDPSQNAKEEESNDSDEEVEYIYEIEYVEESEDEEEAKEDKQQHEKGKTRTEEVKEEPFMPKPILMRQPSNLRKSVSFNSVHSVLTGDNQIIFVDEDDDIFK